MLSITTRTIMEDSHDHIVQLKKKLPKKTLICLFGVCRTRKFFTNLKTSPLPVNGSNIDRARHTWPLRGEGSLLLHCLTVSNLREPVTLTPLAELLAVKLFLVTYFNDLKIAPTWHRTPISRMRGEGPTI